MKYQVNAYLLGFSGEVEANSEKEAELKVRQMCNYPEIAPMIFSVCDVVEFNETTEQPPENKS